MSGYVVGVDGCGGGWIACCCKSNEQALTFEVFDAFEKLEQHYGDAQCIAVDIPIGLRDSWVARGCDIAARQILGQPRGSSVFPAPPRCLLGIAPYAEASRRSRELFRRSLSRQTFHIMPKILEVDEFITPSRQNRIFEVHPEVCFWAMSGQPMTFNKKSQDGYEERRALLSESYRFELPVAENWRKFWGLQGQGVGRDDVMDAAVAAWTASRRWRGEDVRIPSVREKDEHRLWMEIVY